MTRRVKVFVSIEMILYVVFIILDCFFDNMSETSMKVKYAGIVLCFFYVFFLLPEKRNRWDAGVVQVALFFTVLADTCLIWLGKQLEGVGFFIVVQLCYFYRLNRNHVKSIWANFLLCFGFYGIFYGGGLQVDPILMLSMFYFVSLCRNVFDSFMLSKNRFFQSGLFLFLLCDISVLLYNVPSFLTVSSAYMMKVYPVAAIVIWIFYLPSQVFLSLSVEEK